MAIKKPAAAGFFVGLVPRKGLEPSRLAPHGPEPCASTNSATSAPHRSLAAVASYDRRVSTQPLRDLLESAFPDATELDVIDRTGGGDHFQVIVTAPSLSGLSLVEQHRRVYEALSAPLGDGTIHELRIKTKGAS